MLAAEMFASIESDHLPCHCRRVKDIPHAVANIFRRDLPPARRRPPMVNEPVFALAAVRQRRTGADGVDADIRRKRPCRGLGQPPEPDLAQCISGVIGTQVPDPLIYDVDDIAGATLRQLASKSLRQYERRPKIDLHVQVPTVSRRRLRRVFPEHRGIVDQAGDRTERVRGAAAQRL